MFSTIFNVLYHLFAIFGFVMFILLTLVYALEYRDNKKLDERSKQDEFTMVSDVDDIVELLQKEGIEIIASSIQDGLTHIVFEFDQLEKISEFIHHHKRGDYEYV